VQKGTPARGLLKRLAEARIAIEAVDPSINCGRFASKCLAGEAFTVEADIFSDGHDPLTAVLMQRERGARRWDETPMRAIGNDRWRATTRFASVGHHEYALAA
jgi:starch synthase (maltosyl-transferring)